MNIYLFSEMKEKKILNNTNLNFLIIKIINNKIFIKNK